MKLLTIIGARPQFIKASAVSREIGKHEGITERIVHTGQHYDANMSKVFFEEMEIPEPAHRLEMGNLSHGAMTGQMLEGLEKIMIEEEPDFVLVYGDTNTTIAGALAAKKLHIKVVHVEAGLRSFNMKMPEEVNRVLTDRISDVLFCPTTTAVKHLEKEGYKDMDCRIVKNGDVMQDAALFYAEKAADKSTIISDMKLKKYVLCTIHRPENTDHIENLTAIASALHEISKDQRVVLPLHPRTRKFLKEHGIELDADLIDPVGYFDMIQLIRNSSLVLTDSGGLQKEAYFFAKHCVTMRGETEWTELVKGGYNVVTGADEKKILDGYKKMSKKKSDFTKNLYGNGKASEVIVKSLMDIAG
jgi:UDP-GlcNAc3NAcA epimerase